MDIDPGGVATLVFRVSNLSPSERTYSGTVELPEGWHLVTSGDRFVVSPLGTDVRLVSVHIPSDAVAGSYKVTYTAINEMDASDTDHSTVVITVAPITALEVQILKAPRFLMAGHSGRIEGLVANKGNVVMTSVVKAHASRDLAFAEDSLTIAVPPQSIVPFAFDFSAGRDILTHTRSRLRISAEGIDHPKSLTTTSVLTEVFPTDGTSGVEDKPARLTLIGAGDERGTGAQARLTGGGPFAGGYLNVEATAPDLQRTSVYGLRSVYSGRYESDPLDIQLGDNVYALTPLTEPGRFAAGAGARSRMGRLELRGYAHKVRYSFPDDQQAAFSASYFASTAASIGVNIFRRRGLYDGQAYSLRTTLRGNHVSEADLECGVDSNNGVDTPSCNLAVSARWSGLSLNLRALKTQPDFPGYTSDLNSRSLGIVARSADWLRTEGSVLQHNRGLDNGFSRKYTVARLGTILSGRRRAFPASLFVYYQHRNLTYRGLDEATDYRQNAIRLRAGYDWKRLGVSGGVEKGWTSSGAATASFQRVEAEIRPFPRAIHRVSASIAYVSGVSDFGTGRQRQLLVNLDLNVQLKRRTRGLLHLFSSLDRGERTHTYAYGRVQLDHQFRRSQRLGIKVQHSKFVGLNESSATDFSVSYSIPIGLPDQLKRGRTRVAGRVYDLETGEGVGGVLIYVGGNAAVTKPNGRFDMHIPAGAGYLRIDRVSAGIDRVPARPMPVAIGGAGASSEDVNIPLAQAGNVSGRMNFAEAQSGIAAIEPIDPGSLRFLLELSNEQQRYRDLTDREGRFEFAEIPPGKWKLSVVDARLPSGYRLQEEFVDLTLTPGASLEVDFSVVPRKRSVRLIDSGVITVKTSTADSGVARDTTPKTGPVQADVERDSTRVGSGPGETEPESTPTLSATATHVVQEGESLWRIARTYYGRGSAWPRIYRENGDRIEDPDLIRPGWTLKIPPAFLAESAR